MFVSHAAVLGPNNANCRAWCAAVAANGGSVSLVHQDDMAWFFGLEEAAGNFALCDDMWWLGGENPIQIRTSLKQRRLGTFVNSPVVSPRRHTQFDGAASYFKTGFIPSSHASQATVNNNRVATYDRVNTASNNYTGGASSASNRTCLVRGRLASPSTVVGAQAMSSAFQGTLNPASDGRGLISVSRNGTLTTDVAAYQRGAALAIASAPTTMATTSLPTSDVAFGCLNNGGTYQTFRPCSLLFGWFGAQLNSTQEAAQSANLQLVGGRMGAAV